MLAVEPYSILHCLTQLTRFISDSILAGLIFCFGFLSREVIITVALNPLETKNSDPKNHKPHFRLINNQMASHIPCLSNIHSNSAKFLHPKHWVPVELFRHDPTDPNSKLWKACYQCRQIKAEYRTTAKEKHKVAAEEAKESVADGSSDLMYCSSLIHGPATSKLLRHEIPIDMMQKEPGNVHSEFHKTCLDCRNYINRYNADSRAEVKELKEQGHIICRVCRKEVEAYAIGKDGKVLSCCETCDKNAKRYAKDRKRVTYHIKLERVLEVGCSCLKCGMIIFKSADPNSLAVVSYPTYFKQDGIRYVAIDGFECPALTIVNFFRGSLALTVLELDHMTMEEQLAAGVITRPEDYVPKKCKISELGSEAAVRLEAMKCQLICSFCHIKETINRAPKPKAASTTVQKKLDYVYNLKRQGCQSCGFTDQTMMRFFEMDHLGNKVADISNMCYSSKYSYNDVVLECAKCRVLCRFCHRNHTNKSSVILNAILKEAPFI